MPRAAGNDDHYTFKLQGGVGEIRLPSVTHIIHSVLGAPQHVVNWATKFANKEEMNDYRDKRSGEGTAAHEFAEEYAKRPGGSAPQTGFDEAFLRFVRECEPVFALSERVVWSTKLGYAGTLDCGLLGEAGTITVCDYKTRNKNVYEAYDSDKLQCAAYYVAAVEMGIIPEQAEPKVAVLMLKENARYTYREYPAPVRAWLALLELHKELTNA